MSDLRYVSRKNFTEFIELYRSFPCLWQVKNKEYYDRNKRDLAYAELVTKYKDIDPSADRFLVVKKINSFRTVYKKELAKINKSLKSGAGVDEVYKPQLWYFGLLDFLNDLELPARTSRNKIHDSDEETRTETEETGDETNLDGRQSLTDNTQIFKPSSISRTSLSRTRKRNLNEVEQATPKAMKKEGGKTDLVKVDDPHDIFGKHVANKLRNVKPHQLKFAQKLISDVLFEADMESLNRFWKVTGPVDPSPQYSGHPAFMNLLQTAQNVNLAPGPSSQLSAEQQISPGPSSCSSGNSGNAKD